MFTKVRATLGRFLAVGGLLGSGLAASVVVAPAAHADTWKAYSSKETCTHYSFGTMCTTRTTMMRQVDYCTRPPISNPWGQMGWASYCIKYKETNRYV